MNCEFDRNLSLEELKQRNPPQPVQPLSGNCPLTREDLDELFSMLRTLQEQMKTMQVQNRTLQARLGELPVRAELAKIQQGLEQIQQSFSQAGKRKGRSFSLRRLRLPRVEIGPAWLIIIPMLLGLLAIWYSWGTLWNGLQTFFP